MNKEKLNDAVFDALFSQAVIDEFEKEMISVKSKELDGIYTPSQKFKTQMKSLFEINNRKTFIKNFILYTRKAAVVILILLGCIFSALLFNKDVQAMVNNIIIEIHEKFNSIIFKSEELHYEASDWIVNYIPQGYSAKDYERLGNLVNIEFTNEQNDKISLTYSPRANAKNISFDNENHEMIKCKVLGEDAYCIVSNNDKFSSGIIWNMDGYSFDLWGRLSMDELKKMAESLTKK